MNTVFLRFYAELVTKIWKQVQPCNTSCYLEAFID